MKITITITVTITVAITITIKVTITSTIRIKIYLRIGNFGANCWGGVAVHLEVTAPHGVHLVGM